ncbi:ecotin family protein [Pseudomonadota bacterium]
MFRIKLVRAFQLLLANLLVVHIVSFAADHPELKAFPVAKEGMQRFVIVLPHKARGEDDSFKVELIPGKVMLTDGVNLIRLGIAIEPRPLQGWGYTYYQVNGRDIAMSTLMAAPEGQQVRKFVSGASIQIRYNSRLPIVIYAPRGYDIQYRIWHASEKIMEAEPG